MPIATIKRFRFRPIPFLAAVLVAAIGVSLGNWQQHRAADKTALGARLEAAKAAPVLALDAAPADIDRLEWRRLRVTGRFVPEWTLYLDNRPYQGRAGFYVLTPLRIGNSARYVLVERGWLPRDPVERQRLPSYATADGTVTVEGIARRNPGHVMELGAAPALKPGAIVQNVDLARLGAASGLALQPLVLEQTAAAALPDDRLVRDWPVPTLGVATHRGYAFQWYALALTALVFFVWTGFRRGTN